MANTSKSVERFRTALMGQGLEDTIAVFETSARTAEQAAAVLGCPVAAIVKSLVFADARDEPLLVLAAGDGRVDEARVGEWMDGPVRLGDARFVRAAAGYAIGGVPPFGHRQALPTLVDERLCEQERVWAAAGRPEAMFSLTPDELVRATGGEVVAVR